MPAQGQAKRRSAALGFGVTSETSPERAAHAGSVSPFQGWSQRGIVFLGRRCAVPQAGLGLPFQGEENCQSYMGLQPRDWAVGGPPQCLTPPGNLFS